MPSRVLVAIRVRASRERAFQAFTREISEWWRPNMLFQFTDQDTGALSFEPHAGGRFLMVRRDGSQFEIGRVTAWNPPSELAFSWRQESFGADQETEVVVRFEAAGSETRVTVEHLGWDGLPREHVARHGFPLDVFQLRHAEWWQSLLGRLQSRALQGGQIVSAHIGNGAARS
jgi:uncharacterized protein YndB with AHSA1/START domain